jgi:hypothetical protein
LPKHQQPFIPLLLLKHRLSATFHPFPPDAETPLINILFIPFPSSFSPPSSTKQFRPAIVSPLLLLKHLLPATLHHFIHDAETPSFNTI